MFGEEIRKYLHPDPAIVDMVAQVTQHPDRPRPLREIDQIFMLPGSQAVQALLTIDYLKYRDVAFVGDGDAMALVIAHLANRGVFKSPSKMRVFDFDQRILDFIKVVVKDLGLPADLIDCYLYNVRDPIDQRFKGAHDVFYTNPPYGSVDCGASGKLFLSRCMEFSKPAPSWGVALLPFAHKEDWSRLAMASIQAFLSEHGYVVSEMIREIHQYHLEDRPSLRSCNVVVDRVTNVEPAVSGTRVAEDANPNFYGRTAMKMPAYIDSSGRMVMDEDITPSNSSLTDNKNAPCDSPREVRLT